MTALPLDLDALLADASLPEDTVPVCLDGRLLSALGSALEHLAEVVDTETRDVQVTIQQTPGGTGPDVTAAADRASAAIEAAKQVVTDAQDAVKAARVQFRLRALAPYAVTALKGEHPPREKNTRDERAGVNLDTYLPALLRASITSPTIRDDEQWERLCAVMQFGEWTRLLDAADLLSHRQVALVPFKSGAYAPTPTSDETSSSPAD